MGLQALEGNGITLKLLFLFGDNSLTSSGEPLKRCRRGAVWAFVALELVGFGATFAITQTIAAIGYARPKIVYTQNFILIDRRSFPVFIFLLIPARALILPNYFTPEELGVLDAPTVSLFTLESVGGGYYDTPESSDDSTPAEASSDTLTKSDVSVMERGDSAGLGGRRSSAVRHSIGDDGADRVEEEGPSRAQHRRTAGE